MREKDRAKDRKKFRVDILGENMPVVGNVSREYVESLADYINEVGDDISRAYPSLPRRRLLGLTLLNIADDYQEAKKERDNLQKSREALEQENEELQQEIKRLREENEELLDLLQEVD